MTTATIHSRKFDVLFRGEELLEAVSSYKTIHNYLKNSRHVRLISKWEELGTKKKNLQAFVVLNRSRFLDDSEFNEMKKKLGQTARFLVLPDDSPEESLLERVFQLNIRTVDRIHTPRLKVDDLNSYIHRFLAALELYADTKTIADAWWEADEFVVWSPIYERLKVSVEQLPKLNQASPDELAQYDIDEHGEFIYWPSHDVHMGWSQFEQAVDPQSQLRAQQKSAKFNKKYGEAIKTFREEKGLRQADICGLDSRTIRRIEHGVIRATSNALGKLAIAHEMQVNEYLSVLASKL